MRWIRRHPRESAALTAMIAGAVMLLVALMNILSDDSSSSLAGPDSSQVGPAIQPPILDVPQELSPEDIDPADGLPPALGGGPSTVSGFGTFPGLQGEGGIKGLSKHTVTLRVTSSEPIAYVGYVIPTSRDDSDGVVKNLGRSWSLTTTVYGDPDYAQIFSQAGLRAPVTCTITVDGRVTESLTTEGPYDLMFCQG